MRALAITLATLVVLVQYPLWLGKGGWVRVWDLDQRLQAKQASNERLALRNDALAADVRDLKQGLEAVEERARFELGMIGQDEVFVQVIDLRAPPERAK